MFEPRHAAQTMSREKSGWLQYAHDGAGDVIGGKASSLVPGIRASLGLSSALFRVQTNPKNKRFTIEGILSGKTQLYARAFGSESEDSKDVSQRLFNFYYRPLDYVVPVLILVAVGCERQCDGPDLRRHLPGPAGRFGGAARPKPRGAFIAGVPGAYRFGVYDVLLRYRSIDLTPISLHFVLAAAADCPDPGHVRQRGAKGAGQLPGGARYWSFSGQGSFRSHQERSKQETAVAGGSDGRRKAAAA